MFERFTDRARRVVVLAQEEARRLDHNYIGTEHILLGLLSEREGLAAKTLESLGVSLDAVRREVMEIIGDTETPSPPSHIPFTPRSKKVLELSLREALQLRVNYIGTEHVLLGLVREGEGVAAQVLVRLGADLPRVRRAVIERLDEGVADEPRPLTDEHEAPIGPEVLLQLLGDLAAAEETIAGRALAAAGVSFPAPADERPNARVADVDALAGMLAVVLGGSREALSTGHVLLAALSQPAAPVDDADRIRREVFRLLADGATDPT